MLAAPGSSAASSLQITFGPVLTLELQPQGFALHLGKYSTDDLGLTTDTVSSRQEPKRAAARARAFAASASRLRCGAEVSRERSRRVEAPAMSSMAALKAASLVFDGWWKPVIFRTNCREAARTSSGVTGGSKLKRVLMLRHTLRLQYFAVSNQRQVLGIRPQQYTAEPGAHCERPAGENAPAKPGAKRAEERWLSRSTLFAKVHGGMERAEVIAISG